MQYDAWQNHMPIIVPCVSVQKTNLVSLSADLAALSPRHPMLTGMTLNVIRHIAPTDKLLI